MAPSEAAASAIERIGSADVEGALALSRAAGWNQTADDWRLFMNSGRTWGCRDESGRLVATAAALPYEGGAAWVAMVLVAAEARHRGLATSLLGECLATLRAEGRTALLDATPAGAAVYRQLGFVAGFGFERWEGEVGGSSQAIDEPVIDASMMEAAAVDGGVAGLAEIAALDAAASGVGRAALFADVLARPTTRAWLSADRHGFVVARAGQRATQIGPLVAAAQSSALGLLDAALAASSGPVFVDVPVRCGAVADRLAERGFTRQRPFTRMALEAQSPRLVAGERVFALAGPEFG